MQCFQSSGTETAPISRLPVSRRPTRPGRKSQSNTLKNINKAKPRMLINLLNNTNISYKIKKNKMD